MRKSFLMIFFLDVVLNRAPLWLLPKTVAIHANRAAPVRLNEPLFLVLLAVFLLYTLLWTIRLFLRFRPSDGV